MRSVASRAQKTLISLPLRADLVRRATSLGIDLSSLVEAALEREIQNREQAWLGENRFAIRTYNERVGREGIFGDEIRRF